ncbi:hypothetical protein BSKO_07728 [Bryopsis sp. KO-2023]|nr:hypothetical protein BSKO_07728 [Bryopsis sp. KO-2023]
MVRSELRAGRESVLKGDVCLLSFISQRFTWLGRSCSPETHTRFDVDGKAGERGRLQVFACKLSNDPGEMTDMGPIYEPSLTASKLLQFLAPFLRLILENPEAGVRLLLVYRSGAQRCLYCLKIMGRKRRRSGIQEVDGELRETPKVEEPESFTDEGRSTGDAGKGPKRKRKKGGAWKKSNVEKRQSGNEKKPSDGDIAALDDIFEQLKKPDKGKEKVPKKGNEEKESIMPSIQVAGNKDDIFGNKKGPGRKKTEEGYSIYGEDELGLANEGGDTPLCPFDCDCCF